MAKYRVYLVAVAEATVEVEAEDRESAIEAAFENAPAGAIVGEWTLGSDLWPGSPASGDCEEIDSEEI